MEQGRNVVVLSAVRTAIGKYGGGLAAQRQRHLPRAPDRRHRRR